ncbi:phosphopantetheine adenylyltransferase [Tepiditoga spiralis]|uniref:Phosphopantetheine adenylyltransferase n=1 Tax=Tepiditoga spiralis TaxID=2108365 RepID=A0A7G1G9D3_9BACT|nr:pantetheine-phosphate adenylyltransferase [Tepiditoga spiralis]BBE31824.1 phosphopantetheine adenylyltransferase [Tepiditoga spiralis]
MKEVAVYPGSFDPITKGHINIVERAAKHFDKVIILVLMNVNKNYTFSLEERIELTKKCVSHIDNVEVQSYSGLLVNYAKENNIKSVIRGLRAVTDFEYELQMANANRSLYKSLEIFFLMTDTEYSFVSSSMIKEVARFKGDISMWVSKEVEVALAKKFE